jgi:hypothetical protein
MMRRISLVIVLSGALLLTACRRETQPQPKPEAKPKAPPSEALTIPPPVKPVPSVPTTPTPPAQPSAKVPPGEAPAAPPKAAQAQPQPGAVAPVPEKPLPPVERKDVKTRIVRALLGALDEIRGIDDQQRDGVVQSLLAADRDLSQVLGDNSRRMILKANQKPPVPIVGGLPDPPAKQPPAAPVPPPGAAASAKVLPPLPPGQSKEALVQTLLKTIDQMQEDPQVKAALKKALLDADQKLNGSGK